MTFFVHIVAIWLEFVSLAICIGIVVCRLLVFPQSADELPEKGNSFTGGWRLFGIALAVIFASSAADLLLRAASMSGRPISAVFPVITTVLFRTHYGHVWIVRITAFVLLTSYWGMAAKHRDSRIFLVFALAMATFIAATRSASGHASDAGDFSIAEIMDWLHIVAASVWGGGLVVLSVVILPEILRQKNLSARMLASVAGRFSRMAGAAVGMLALTALYNALLHMGSLEGLWLTAYGVTLTVKIVLFFVLVNLGAFNRYVSVPALQQLGGIDPGKTPIAGRIALRFMPRLQVPRDARHAALRFMRSVRTEAILIVIVLFFAALLVQQVPARHALHAMSGQSHSMANSR